MTSPKINMGPGTDIDVPDLLESRMLIQANSGGGKTGIVKVLIEGSNHIVPCIILDKAGEYYPLKEKFPNIIIIGGSHADIALSLRAAGMLPRMIIENRLSVIIDMSGDGMDNDSRAEYVAAFLKSLMNLSQQYWCDYFVIVEEAHLFCGQQDKTPSGKYVKQLMSEGRKMGFCGILVTQRISKLHKDAAAECNNKFVGRTFLDLDMDRSASELGIKGTEKHKLRDLKKQHFYAFGTSIEPHYVHEVVIKNAITKFVKKGVDLSIKPQKPTGRLLAMMEKLNELPAAAEKELKDVKSLQQEVTRLRKELSKKEKSIQFEGTEKKPIEFEGTEIIITAPAVKDKKNNKEIEAITNQLNKTKAYVFELQTELTEQERLSKEWAKLAVSRKLLLDNIYKRLSDTKEKQDGTLAWLLGEKERYPDPEKQKLTKSVKTEMVRTKFAQSVNQNEERTSSTQSNSSLPKGELKVLTACAQFTNGLNRKALTVITGYTRRTRDAYIFALRNKGLAEIGGNDKVLATAKGITELGSEFKKLPTGAALKEHWLKELPQGERIILEKLINVHSEGLHRDSITELTGYTRRTRDAYIYNMLAKEIVEIPSKGIVKASDYLFD